MTWNATAQAMLDAFVPVDQRWLVWVEAVELATGDPAPMGIWSGGMSRTLTVDGEARLYHGAQGAMTLPTFTHTPGTLVFQREVALAVSPEAETLVRGYRVQFRPVHVHLALFDAASGQLVDIRREFYGEVDAAPIFTPPLNGVASITLKMSSGARSGTTTGGAKKSDQSQQQRSGDGFRRFGDSGPVASDPWGAED